MLPSGTFNKSEIPHDAAPLAHPDAGMATLSNVKPGKPNSPQAKAMSKVSPPKALKMKSKGKFVVTDEQLDKLADILCEMFHNETLQPVHPQSKSAQESLTALLA